jgi:hypothetical protein
MVDVHSHLAEDSAAVEERLRSGLEVLPLKNVWMDRIAA